MNNDGYKTITSTTNTNNMQQKFEETSPSQKNMNEDPYSQGQGENTSLPFCPTIERPPCRRGGCRQSYMDAILQYPCPATHV